MMVNINYPIWCSFTQGAKESNYIYYLGSLWFVIKKLTQSTLCKYIYWSRSIWPPIFKFYLLLCDSRCQGKCTLFLILRVVGLRLITNWLFYKKWSQKVTFITSLSFPPALATFHSDAATITIKYSFEKSLQLWLPIFISFLKMNKSWLRLSNTRMPLKISVVLQSINIRSVWK